MTATSIDATREPEDPFAFLLHVTREHGDAVQFEGQTGSTFLLNHPRYAKEVLQNPRFERTSMVKLVLGDGLLASDGDYWKKQRQLCQGLFQPTAVADFGPIILRHTRACMENWALAAAREERPDAAADMTMLTLSIIVDGLFGVRLDDGEMRELCEALNILLDDIGAMACSQLNTPLTFSASARERFVAAMRSLDGIVAHIVEERRRNPDGPGSFLSMLLSAEHPGKGRLTNRQIRDEVVTMLIAGHETTALALSWAWHLLARHPETEQQLHAELDGVLGGRPPQLADLADLPFTLSVVQESMRLYPPVWLIARRSASAVDVAGCHVPANVIVVVSPYAMHRHPKLWPEPDKFDPRRFSADARYDKYAYIPFGGGRHLCLGIHLGLIEGHLILASLAQRFRVRPLGDRPVLPKAAITLRLGEGLVAEIQERRPAPVNPH